MELEEIDPLPRDRYKIGLVYNVKKDVVKNNIDDDAEFDSIETVECIKETIETFKAEVYLLEADPDIFAKLAEIRPDIVFNIAEGSYGRGREAQIPAILSFLQIAYTGSDETALCVCLDKSITKRILSTHNIRTPGFLLWTEYSQVIPEDGYPYIVKPNFEGSGKGIGDTAVVSDPRELSETVGSILAKYKQPVLIEEYISGREFTVALTGNYPDITVYPPMEIKFISSDEKYRIYSYEVKQNYTKYVEYVHGHDITGIPEQTIREMEKIAREAFVSLGLKDFARMDFRKSEDNRVYFIEVNPLAGLLRDIVISLCPEHNNIGNGNDKLILNAALKRYSMNILR